MSAKKTTRLELLAPAGDQKRLEIALAYGADAVYLSGKSLGMRAACKNFDHDELNAAATEVHARGKKLYVTLNIFPFDADLKDVDGYLEYLSKIGADGVIVSDIGLIKRVLSRTDLDVHVSTQANVTNADAAAVYADMGVKRIVLARELSLDMIRDIRKKLDSRVELEAFVHGAMCISYSGRCLLSAYLSERSANRGECIQTCRMFFKPECSAEALEFVEDDGTYIFGGNDLNMIEHLGELADAGLTAFKIEGRVKSEYYVGCVVNAYRKALDALGKGESVSNVYVQETKKAPNRGYNTGFYFGAPTHFSAGHDYYDFCGIVVDNNRDGAVVEMRNRFKTGDTLEVLSYDAAVLNSKLTVPVMSDCDGNDVTDAKVPVARYTLRGIFLPMLSMLRRPAASS